MDACQTKVLESFNESKGHVKQNKDSTNQTKKTKKANAFLQVRRNIDDENAEAAEMARLEAQSDKDMGEDDDETSKTDDTSENDDEAESFLQVKQTKRNIDDDNAEAAEMARLEAQSD